MIRRSSAVIMILLSLVLGCGSSDSPKLAPATGIVSWQGKPLPGATVSFTPEQGPISIGRTDAEGRFSLVTQGKPGATIGAHRVTIQAYDSSKQPPAKADPKIPEGENIVKPVSLIDEKYSKLAESGLTATVGANASDNQFDFKIQ